jgi:hypothetical protein
MDDASPSMDMYVKRCRRCRVNASARKENELTVKRSSLPEWDVAVPGGPSSWM